MTTDEAQHAVLGERSKRIRPTLVDLLLRLLMVPTRCTWNWKAVYRAYSPGNQKSESGARNDQARPACDLWLQSNPKKARYDAPGGGNDGEGQDDEDQNNWVPLHDLSGLQPSENYRCPLFYKLPNACSLQFETQDEAM